MTITVTFDSIEEMKQAAKELLGAEPETQPLELSVQIPDKTPDEMLHEMGHCVTQPYNLTPVPQGSPTTAPVQPTAPQNSLSGTPAPVQPTATQATSAAAQMPRITPTATPAPAVTPAVPTTEPAYKLDDLSRAGIQLVEAGKQPQLLELLAQFGVDSLPALPAEQYGAFATALRGLGASI